MHFLLPHSLFCGACLTIVRKFEILLRYEKPEWKAIDVILDKTKQKTNKQTKNRSQFETYPVSCSCWDLLALLHYFLSTFPLRDKNPAQSANLLHHGRFTY